MTALSNRHDFVVLFEVVDGNPNGDPDAANMPRLDPETGQGLVSDVSLKRRIRNYVELARSGEPGFAIYVQDGAILNDRHREAYAAIRPEREETAAATRLNPRDRDEAASLSRFMCANFFDIRSFGAVMSTGINCGQVRGPVQLSFARSVEPVMPIEITMTRMAAMSSAGPARRDSAGDDGRREHRGFGRKYIVPYGLYRAHGFVSAKLAERTGFSPGDLTVLWEAVINMFEHDRSAGRGQMAVRRLIVFRHASALGCAPAHALFDRVTVARTQASPLSGPPSDRDGEPPPARRFADYRVTVDREDLPTGVETIELV